jgi:hypothetical protein
MNKRIFGADLLLLLTAAVWGFGFVAQRSGMRYVGPFAFNGIRFILGSVSPECVKTHYSGYVQLREIGEDIYQYPTPENLNRVYFRHNYAIAAINLVHPRMLIARFKL